MSTSYLQDIQKSRSANIYGNGFTLSFRRQTAQSVIPSIFQDHHYGGSKAVARFLLDASLPICARDLWAVGNDPSPSFSYIAVNSCRMTSPTT
jgi:hypothetical protein